MVYADYSFYSNDYYGSSIPESDFNFLAARASDYIDYITMGRAAEKADLLSVKKCCCALAEAYQTIEKARTASISDNGELASQTVGSWSQTYHSGTETAAIYEGQLYGIAQRYLVATNLLYRGGGCQCQCFHTL